MKKIIYIIMAILISVTIFCGFTTKTDEEMKIMENDLIYVGIFDA